MRVETSSEFLERYSVLGKLARPMLLLDLRTDGKRYNIIIRKNLWSCTPLFLFLKEWTSIIKARIRKHESNMSASVVGQYYATKKYPFYKTTFAWLFLRHWSNAFAGSLNRIRELRLENRRLKAAPKFIKKEIEIEDNPNDWSSYWIYRDVFIPASHETGILSGFLIGESRYHGSGFKGGII